MSKQIPRQTLNRIHRNVGLFAALGDETRLNLLIKLADGQPRSIKQLAIGADMSRQAITKHLQILQTAGLIGGSRQGRENVFQVQPKSLQQAREALEIISRQWDNALERLRMHVED